ncbi:sulfatase family protein [Stieleria varia]|nr:sulfatase [Stieleria varia]
MLLSLFAVISIATKTLADDSPSVGRPNIVFLLSDDQCTYSVGCYGNPDVQTPHMDRLAADGIVFDRHYVTTAICMASRATIMTGKYEYKTGCNFEHGALMQPLWNDSYPMLLRKAGYVTAMAGKIGLEVTQTPGKKGELPEDDFDAWGAGPGQTSYKTAQNKSMQKYAEQYPHSTLSYAAFADDFIASAANGDKPFCLSISFKAPHQPETPDERFDHVYQNKTFTKPANFGREFGQHFSLQSQQGRQFERFHSWHYSDQYDQVMRRYHQQVYAVDVALGKIRQSLVDHGVDKNTIVIFTSDNGFLCGSHGYGSKVLPYEESSRVPLMIYDPRHPNSGKGIRCKELTGNIDFLPTILSLAGVELPKDIDGRSLTMLYDEPETPIHKSLALINVWGPKKVHSLSVVTRDWKYIRWPYAAGEFKATDELYHIAADPMELQNMIDSAASAAQLTHMRAIYDSAVAKWKADAVPFHGYQPFGEIFSR